MKTGQKEYLFFGDNFFVAIVTSKAMIGWQLLTNPSLQIWLKEKNSLEVLVKAIFYILKMALIFLMTL